MFVIKLLPIVLLLNVVVCYSEWRDKISSIGKNFPYVRRADWNASSSNGFLISSYKSIPQIVVKHTNTPYCYRKLACAKSVKKLQHQNMAKENFTDIQYNFLIDPHGNVFEGLGWFNLQSDNVYQKYRTIGFIGIENTEIRSEQVEAITLLFEEALKNDILIKNYHLCSTPDLVEIMKNVKIDLEMDMVNVNSKNITRNELQNLKSEISMENIECVMYT